MAAAPGQGEEQGGFQLPPAHGVMPLVLSVPPASGCEHPRFFPTPSPLFRSSPQYQPWLGPKWAKGAGTDGGCLIQGPPAPGWVCSSKRILAGIFGIGMGQLQESHERVLFARTLSAGAGPADGIAFPGDPSLP